MIPIGTSFELRQQAFSTSIVLDPEGVPAHVIFQRLVACLRGVVDRMHRGPTAMPRLDTLTGRTQSSTSNMYRIVFLLHRPCVPS